MSLFRSRVRLIAVVWLLCQVASLSAFVPDECCPAHTAMAAAKAAATPACHDAETAPAPEPKPGAECQMHHDDGAACPLHRSTSLGCGTLSNGCDGPSQPLARLFSFDGVLGTPTVSILAPSSSPTPADGAHPRLDRFPIPDAPPPKA